MTDASQLPKKLLIFGLVLPLAALVGFLLANPDPDSVLLLGAVVGVLIIPLALKWHHYMLVLSWNLSVIVFFLPGSPPLWMLVALISLGFLILNRIMIKTTRWAHVPSVTWSLIVLAVVVLLTMKATGGLGVRSLGGSSYGGKKYFYILFAIAGFIALSCQRIPIEKAKLFAGSFFLSGLTPVMSNIIYMLGPTAWILFAIFPVETAMGQASEDFAAPGAGVRIGRISGLAFASVAGVTYMLARYGVRGTFDLRYPHRLLIFLGLNMAGMLGGFRSVLLLNAMTFAIQFFAEGHHRNRAFPLMLAGGLALGAMVLPFADKLPMSVQRTISFLPVDLNPAARLDAQASTEWRLQMWSVLWPEVGRYFWVGKGYTASATDYYLAMESFRRGLGAEYDVSLVAGDYHSGPLSVIIPFGVFGAIAFLWFLGASLRVLYLNMRNGDARLLNINTALFAIFLARTISFFFVFGGFHSDIVVMAGLIGLSISLNGGVRRKAPEPVSAAVPSGAVVPASA